MGVAAATMGAVFGGMFGVRDEATAIAGTCSAAAIIMLQMLAAWHPHEAMARKGENEAIKSATARHNWRQEFARVGTETREAFSQVSSEVFGTKPAAARRAHRAVTVRLLVAPGFGRRAAPVAPDHPVRIWHLRRRFRGGRVCAQFGDGVLYFCCHAGRAIRHFCDRSRQYTSVCRMVGIPDPSAADFPLRRRVCGDPDLHRTGTHERFRARIFLVPCDRHRWWGDRADLHPRAISPRPDPSADSGRIARRRAGIATGGNDAGIPHADGKRPRILRAARGDD